MGFLVWRNQGKENRHRIWVGELFPSSTDLEPSNDFWHKAATSALERCGPEDQEFKASGFGAGLDNMKNQNDNKTNLPPTSDFSMKFYVKNYYGSTWYMSLSTFTSLWDMNFFFS